MKYLALLCCTLLSLSCANKGLIKGSNLYTPSILQGLTTKESTQISVLRPGNIAYTYKISPTAKLIISTKESPTSPWVIDHLKITNINLADTYSLKIYNKNKVIDTRNFKALNTNLKNFTIAVASCMDLRKKEFQKQMWTELNSRKADLFFFIGDNVYADVDSQKKGLATPTELWNKYVETRQTLEIFKVKSLTPTLATWDDHDFGYNGGGTNYPYKKQSLYIFNSFYAQNPIESPQYAKGPGVAFMIKLSGQNFYFMDNRYFRTNEKTKPDWHWGEQQENWLFDHLKTNHTFSWIINGNQFFGGYQRFESFERNHPTNFVKFINKIKKIKTKVAFISGDRHLSELMKISSPDLPYNTLEITSSGMHSKVYPSTWDKMPNPRQIYGQANSLNYSVLKVKEELNKTHVEIQAYGLNNVLFYDHKQIFQ